MARHRSGELTHQQTRRLLELQLQEDGEELNEKLWADLLELGHVEDVEQGEMSIRELAAKHGEFLHVLRSHGRSQQQPQRQRHDVPPDARLEILSDILSQRAAEEPEVIAFRTRTLGGNLLAWENVDAWIKEQAKRDGPHTDYLSVAVPEGYQLRGDKTGIILTEPPLTVSKDAAGWGIDVRQLEFTVPDKPWKRRIPTKLWGVLDVLRTLSERLAKKYGWEPSQATVFVLTGIPVALSRGKVTLSRHFPYEMTSRLTMELDPRISPKEVLSLYRRYRKELLGGRYQPMDRKHLELARFYEGRGKGPWRADMAEWNSTQVPEWHYSDWRNFRRDCVHAWERLFGKAASFQFSIEKGE